MKTKEMIDSLKDIRLSCSAVMAFASVQEVKDDVNLDLEALDHAIELLKAEGELTSCAWCKGDWTDNFSVIDENFGQPLTHRHVKFCPMCGRKLRSPAEERKGENP